MLLAAIWRRDVHHDLNNDQPIGCKGSLAIGPRPSLSRFPITYEKGDCTQEMLSFFGATLSSETLPEAKNMTTNLITTWWWSHESGRSCDMHRDHMITEFLVAIFLHGQIGVILPVVSGILFFFQL